MARSIGVPTGRGGAAPHVDDDRQHPGGLEGPVAVGAQPCVFGSRASDPVWSPCWDHITYAWSEDAEARVLPDEDQLHAGRDAGELEEFVGTTDSGGQGFVVNCPVPVVAANTFRA